MVEAWLNKKTYRCTACPHVVVERKESPETCINCVIVMLRDASSPYFPLSDLISYGQTLGAEDGAITCKISLNLENLTDNSRSSHIVRFNLEKMVLDEII